MRRNLSLLNYCGSQSKRSFSATKKFTGFCLKFVTNSLLCFGCSAARQHADGFFSFMHNNIYIMFILKCAYWRLAKELPCLCSTLATASLFLKFFFRFCHTIYLRLIVQPGAGDDRHRKHIRTTTRYSIQNRSKQPFFIHNIHKKQHLVSFPV